MSAPSHIIESQTFRLVLGPEWVQHDMPGATMGDAAFTHAENSFAFYQTVIGHTTPNAADLKLRVQQVMLARIDQMEANGHAIERGKLAFTPTEWGCVGVLDVALDKARYGVLAGYGFPDIVLLHFIDGAPEHQAAVRAELLKIIDTVEYKGGPDTSALQLNI